MGGLKARGEGRYDHDPEDKPRQLLGDTGDNHYWRKCIEPHGWWWRAVELFLAERNGDAKKLAQLQAEEQQACKARDMQLRAFARR